MSVKIRLTRLGDKKSPFYRVVVADSRKSRDGEVIDNLGYYNPLVEKDALKIDETKALEWIKKGAQPTETARTLLVKANIVKDAKPYTSKKVTAKKKDAKKD
jgi:small subunit ribosomal protein S16